MAEYSFTSLFALVPADFADRKSCAAILRNLFSLDQTYNVMTLDIPRWGALLLYSWEKETDSAISPSSSVQPLIFRQLNELAALKEHNKLIMDFDSLHKKTTLLLAEGDRLITANCYHTVDLVTAIYYMLEIMNKSQINPQQTTLHFAGKADDKELKMLRSYVKEVRMKM